MIVNRDPGDECPCVELPDYCAVAHWDRPTPRRTLTEQQLREMTRPELDRIQWGAF